MTGQADHLVGSLPGRFPAALALVALGLAGGWALAQEQPADLYLPEDAVLSGKVLQSFTVGGETVNVVLGDFSLTLGKRRLSGRDAVMWIRQTSLGRQVLRDMEIYVEGDARAVEPDGTVTTDRVMLVTLHQRGQLRAKVGQQAESTPEPLPLYVRAGEYRRRAASQPAVRLPPSVLATEPTTARAPRPPSREPATKPAKEPAFLPVTFRSDEFSSEEIPDPISPERKLRLTLAKGNVYLSQGSPEEEAFLEMRAQAAVVYSLGEEGAAGPLPGRIIGAYLENDVVMRRGERTVTGSRLFYDFQTGKALILEPVFRTIQEQREIPIYIRGTEARQLQARAGPGELRVEGTQWVFTQATVTTSDFYSPSYAISGRRAYLEDTTPYDEKGQPLAPRSYRTKLLNTTFDVRSVPVLWWPYAIFEGEQGHTALRRVEVGHNGNFGWGVSTSWFLFRLLGVPSPPGMGGRLEADIWQHGFLIGPRVEYARENYSGLLWGSYVQDNQHEDDFGTQRKDIAAPTDRGRFLSRHKQYLPQDWEMQAEISYLSDRNFLEKYYPGEFWTGKEQETLIYAKKQHDNWAFTALGQWRINDFLTQTESYPDLAAYLVGQSLWNDLLTLYSEAHLGALRYRPAEDSSIASSPPTGRADTRQEIDAPLTLWPVKVVPFAVGRATWWCQTPDEGGQEFRPWGQIGLNATTHIWRIYDQVESRLWDVHKLKHIITPYGGVFWADTNVSPSEVYPFSPEIEQYTRRLGGGTVGVLQVLQTKRGPPDQQEIVDWLRFDIAGAFFDDAQTHLPADGRYFWYRPEFSLPRNSINADLSWIISDSTTLLADANFDTDTCDLGRADVGIFFGRDPRVKYYVGSRYIRDLDSHVGTFGLRYDINRKYQFNVFQQYDFQLDGGRNQSTNVTLIRKFPRLYVGFSFTYNRTQNDVGVAISIWPEGIPEARFGGPRFSLMNAFGPGDE